MVDSNTVDTSYRSGYSAPVLCDLRDGASRQTGDWGEETVSGNIPPRVGDP